MSYLVVCPLSQLEKTIQLHRPREMITLMSPGAVLARPSTISPENHYSLTFNDITEPREGYIPPVAADILTIIKIAEHWEQKHPLLIHCQMGISRSTAAAFITACSLLPKKDELQLALLLRKLSPSATPNKLMIALADNILNCNGRMIKAIESIGRGADAFEGTPFALPIV